MSDSSGSGRRARTDGLAGERRRIPRLHVITDDEVLARPDFGRRARAVLAAGGPGLALHVRGPDIGGRELFERARDLTEPARAASATLVVNDRVDVALVLELDGVHLGGRSIPPGIVSGMIPSGMLLGVSVHGVDEAVAAGAVGPDYLVAGTVFSTPSHPGRSGGGPELVEAVVASVDVPVVAIGGVTPERVGELRAAGAYGVAALRGVWEAGDPGESVTVYLDALGGP